MKQATHHTSLPSGVAGRAAGVLGALRRQRLQGSFTVSPVRLSPRFAASLHRIQVRGLLNNRGFTMPELLVVIILIGSLSSLLIFYSFSFWRYSSLLEADLETYVERLNANDFIREKIGTSSGLITQNSIEDDNTHNPDPDIPSGLYWIPIHAIPKNTVATGSGTEPLLYYKRYSTNSSGAYIMNGTQPYEDEFILYIDRAKKQLLVRSLANSGASGNALKTSCPPSIATALCPADKVIITNLSSIDAQYFSKSGNPVDYTSSTDPDTGEYNGPDFPVVEVLEVEFHVAKKPFLQKSNATINDTVIRIALRNT